jgi:hypothetical protein
MVQAASDGSSESGVPCGLWAVVGPASVAPPGTGGLSPARAGGEQSAGGHR